jgi:hypothetical protein
MLYVSHISDANRQMTYYEWSIINSLNLILTWKLYYIKSL